MMKGSILFLVACFFACTLAVINPTIANLTAGDNNALNYALTLENLEANFYNTFQARFSAADFAAAGYPASVYTYFTLIAAHENAHVGTLRAALIARGATPVVNCTYSWGTITTVAQYIGLAKVFENVGVTAYDGSINRIYDANLQQVAATIATVEARHASFLNLLSGENPFPGNQGLDNATAPATIATIISPFIGTCPGGVPTLPNVVAVIPVANPNPTPVNPTQAQLNENDLNALNYALTLELLEATFYNTFQPTYNAAAFAAAGYAPSVSTYFDLIRTHENSHVSALQSTIRSLGGVPVVACTTYNFGVTSLATYISVARTLENTGVSAYDGAVNTIFSGALKQFAATVATVEARHAAFLNNLTGNSPFPASFDTATAPGDIVTGIRPFLGNCPAPQLGSVPVVKTVVPYNNGTDLTTGGSTTRGTTTSGSAPLSFSSAVLLVVVALSAALL